MLKGCFSVFVGYLFAFWLLGVFAFGLFGSSASWIFGFLAFSFFRGFMRRWVASAFVVYAACGGLWWLLVACSASAFRILYFPHSFPAGGFVAFAAVRNIFGFGFPHH